MTKTRKNNGYFRKVKNTTRIVIPVVKTGLKKVGSVAKGVAIKSVPIIEEGASKVYNTMVTGFNLGIQGAKGITSKMRKKRRSKKSRK